MSRILLSALGLLFVACAPASGQDEAPREVIFTSGYDQTSQRYLIKMPEGAVPKAAVLLIALHGHGADRRQFMTPSRDETRAALDVARSNRCIYVTPDYRAKTSWMGPAAEADVLQIISRLKIDYPIQKTILCGGSMGGTSALTFAAMHPDLIDGVVAINPSANLVEYENFQDAIQASFGGTKQQVFEEYKKRSAEYWPERLKMPIAMTLGGKDMTVPPDSALRLGKVLKILGRPVKVIYREDGGHSTNYQDTLEAFEFVFAAWHNKSVAK